MAAKMMSKGSKARCEDVSPERHTGASISPHMLAQGSGGAPASAKGAGKTPLERLTRGCDLISRFALLYALFCGVAVGLCLYSAWKNVGTAYELGASDAEWQNNADLWHALYTSVYPGSAVGGGSLFSWWQGGVLLIDDSLAGYDVDFSGACAAIESLASGLPTYALLLACALYVARLFRWMGETARPFSDRVVHDLRVVGWLLIASGAAPVACCWVAWLLRPEGICFRLKAGDLAPVIAGLLVFAINLVFAYGAELQRRDDETL